MRCGGLGLAGRTAAVLLRFLEQINLLLEQLILEILAGEIERHLLLQLRLADIAIVEAALDEDAGCRPSWRRWRLGRWCYGVRWRLGWRCHGGLSQPAPGGADNCARASA